MRSIFSNTWLLVAFSIIFLIGNIYLSITTDSPHWFQRAGSIIVVLGIIITARRPIRLGKEYKNEDWNLPDSTKEGIKVLMDDRAEFIIGPITALIGTLIWGYGDLILPFALRNMV